jgi:hypothetical protein
MPEEGQIEGGIVNYQLGAGQWFPEGGDIAEGEQVEHEQAALRGQLQEAGTIAVGVQPRRFQVQADPFGFIEGLQDGGEVGRL